MQYLVKDKDWWAYDTMKKKLSVFVTGLTKVLTPEFPPDQRRIGLEIYLHNDGSIEYFGYKMMFHRLPDFTSIYGQTMQWYPRIIVIYPIEVFGCYAVRETTSLMNIIQRLKDLEIIQEKSNLA